MAQNNASVNIEYNYHYHSDECYKTGQCYMTVRESGQLPGQVWIGYDHSECGQQWTGIDWKDADSGYSGTYYNQYHTYTKLICGYNDGQIVSATIIY